MNNELRNTTPYNAAGTTGANTALVRNRVLRNTYTLLAISLIPTILGAFVGLQAGFAGVMNASPGISLIVFLVGAFGMMYLIEKNKNSGVGVALLLAFTFFMGVMLSRLLSFVLGLGNGASLIMVAFGGTATIFAAMATIATVSKRDFSQMGKWLMIGAIVLLVAMLANFFLQMPALMLALSVMAIIIFSGFMLYDVQRVVNGGETNYISATLAIYLSIYNVFSNLLAILGLTSGND